MKTVTNTILTVGAALAIIGCCGPKETETPAGELLARLDAAAAEGKFYYAHQDDAVYGHSWKVEDVENDPLGRSDVAAVCGSAPAMVGFDLGGIEMGDAANLDSVDFALMRRAAVAHVAKGGIVTFSWHPRNPLTGGDSWDISSGEVVEYVLDGGAGHGMFMEWLGRTADFLLSLRDADGKLIPLVFRPWHENIGTWFWWGGKLCTPEQYIALYRLTRDYMTSRGLDNIVWAYSPNSDISAEEYFSRYPGDEYVDILGVDQYQFLEDPAKFDSEQERLAAACIYFIDRMRFDLKYMAEFAAEHGKLIAVCETGFEGIPYPKWWTEVLLDGVAGAPVCYVLTWRNAWDKPGHFYAPFEGSADAEDFIEFYRNERTIFLK